MAQRDLDRRTEQLIENFIDRFNAFLKNGGDIHEVVLPSANISLGEYKATKETFQVSKAFWKEEAKHNLFTKIDDKQAVISAYGDIETDEENYEFQRCLVLELDPISGKFKAKACSLNYYKL